jgi:hypothetical protein
LVAKVDAQRREQLPAAALEARKAWRDRILVTLIKAKRLALGQTS